MCQPGEQFLRAKGSSKNQGWSKKEGCRDGSVPNTRLRFSMLRPSAALGVGNAITPPEISTIFVVKDAFSCVMNRLGIPRRANRRSTSSGDHEIMCDNFLTDVIVSMLSKEFPLRMLPRSRNTPNTKNSLTSFNQKKRCLRW
jgi:hypothetical protein